MTMQTTTPQRATNAERVTNDGPTKAIGDAADAVRSVADGVAARIPDAASTARDAIIEGDRQLRDSSDEMLIIGATLSFGLATGLLLAGANRGLVAIAMIPVGAIGFRLLSRAAAPTPAR
jgi:hypothetical protein